MVSVNDPHYISTLLAVLLLGAVPCAIAPPPTPSNEDSAGVQHMQAAIRVVDPKFVIVQPRISVAVSHSGLLTYDELESAHAAGPIEFATPGPNDIHHIQLTSGSTSAPKAVLLTHGNVAHNIAAIGYASRVVRGADRAFNWLPMYHDMGFIQVLSALLYGLRLGVMKPLEFLRDPLSWPRHMTAHGSNHTAGPPFAYHATAEALSRFQGDDAQIELSALSHAFVGAEPIPLSTLQHFSDSFAPLGLRSNALVPCYGMAESVLATTFALDSRSRSPGDFGRVRVWKRTEGDSPVVSCGSPLDGIQIRIVNDDGAEVEVGSIGNIQISGPSIMLGYRRDDGSTDHPPDGWHETGDRGFLCEGELFIVGRRKEMLIVRGRNMPPYDVERAIEAIPEIGPGQAIVFSVIDQSGKESTVAVVGVSAPDDEHCRLRSGTAEAVRRAFGITLDDIVLVPRASIPRTTSGKLQRLKARELYRAGKLQTFQPSQGT